MTPIQVQLARSRITDLRMRVSGISKVLRNALTDVEALGDPTVTSLKAVILDLQAVSTDFESMCDEQLNDLKVDSNLQAAEARARSEVASGEFDSQG